MMLKRALLQLSPATVVVAALFIVPVSILLAYSLGTTAAFSVDFGFSLDNYREAVTEPLYTRLVWRSLWLGNLVAILSIVLAYPVAYAITLGPLRHRGDVILFAVLISMFSAYIVRVYAWRSLLGANGALNSALQSLGLTDRPVTAFLYNTGAVVVTLVNVLVPLCVLALYSSLADVRRDTVEAATVLGAGRVRTFLQVTLPQSIKGVQAAYVLAFVFAAGDYVTPQLIGGTRAQMLGNAIASKFGIAFNWPLGAALAFTLVAALATSIVVFLGLMRLLGLRERPAS